jgi:phage FluMu protein gp41
MTTVMVELKKGLKIGEDVHKLAEIREATAGDLIEATEESERLCATPEGGYILAASPTMVGLNSLRRQIVKIGDHPGPLTIGELKKLSSGDINILQEASARLERAGLEAIAQKGE